MFICFRIRKYIFFFLFYKNKQLLSQRITYRATLISEIEEEKHGKVVCSQNKQKDSEEYLLFGSVKSLENITEKRVSSENIEEEGTCEDWMENS